MCDYKIFVVLKKIRDIDYPTHPPFHRDDYPHLLLAGR